MSNPDYTRPDPYPAPGASPAELVRTAYQLWWESRGSDPTVVTALMADNITQRSVLDDALPTALSGTKRTRTEIAAYFEELTTMWEMLAYHRHDVIDGGDDVVWIGTVHFRNRQSGREVVSEKVDVLRFENGKVVDVLEMFDSQAFAAALPQQK